MKVVKVLTGLSIFLSACTKDTSPPTGKGNLNEVTTAEISDITATSALGGGNINVISTTPVDAKGICWGTASRPTIANAKSINGSGADNFTSNLTGLLPATTYYVRAFITSGTTTLYGAEKQFRTLNGVPVVTTAGVSSVTSNSATAGGSVTSSGGSTVTAKGICWATTSNPTTSNDKVSFSGSATSFSAQLSGLSGNTNYYVRAYATNSYGTAYGPQVQFTTAVGAPTVSTYNPSVISVSYAYCGGTVTASGGSSVTAKGICWSTVTTTPTISNSRTNEGSGTGSFSSYMGGGW